MGDRGTVAGGTRIRDVVSDVVAEVASDELPVVAGLAELDEAAALRRMARRRARRDPLGFGMGEAVPLVTPVVWLAVSEAARRLGGEAGGGIAAGVKAAVRKVLRRRAAPVVVPPLTRDQLAMVRQTVVELAAQRGLSDQRACVIADAVVARLALPAPDPVAPGDPAGDTVAAREGR